MSTVRLRAPATSTFSNARRTRCAAEHWHDSKMEARVCDRLSRECAASGETLYRQVPFALLGIAPKPNGKPHTIRIDFVIDDGKTWRAVEAKNPSRVSRDWPLRKAAFERRHGPLEETAV